MMTTARAELRWPIETGGTEAGGSATALVLGRGGRREPLPRGAMPGVGTPLLMTAYGPLPELASVGDAPAGTLARIAPAGDASVWS